MLSLRSLSSSCCRHLPAQRRPMLTRSLSLCISRPPSPSSSAPSQPSCRPSRSGRCNRDRLYRLEAATRDGGPPSHVLAAYHATLAALKERRIRKPVVSRVRPTAVVPAPPGVFRQEVLPACTPPEVRPPSLPAITLATVPAPGASPTSPCCGTPPPSPGQWPAGCNGPTWNAGCLITGSGRRPSGTLSGICEPAAAVGGLGSEGDTPPCITRWARFGTLTEKLRWGCWPTPSWRTSCSLAKHGGRPPGTTAGLCGGPAELAGQASSGGGSKNRCSLRCPVSRSVTSGSWCPSLPAVSCTPPSYGALYASPTGPTGLFGPSPPTKCPSSAGHCLPPPQEKSWKQTLSMSFRWVGRGSVPE